jgi:hypothetical protein
MYKNRGGGKGFNQENKISGAGGPVLQGSMKIVAWNCRGWETAGQFGVFWSSKGQKQRIFFFCQKRRMERFWWMLGLTNMLVQEGEGRGGGNCSVLAEGD